ncbi:MAG: hypothetical protein K1X44_08320 [Alphaproteobacteria bacterium]|nr:hypothetical protein [Alphaproteobacteria bacterium]
MIKKLLAIAVLFTPVVGFAHTAPSTNPQNSSKDGMQLARPLCDHLPPNSPLWDKCL